jgi:hypothetical protein
MAIWNSEKVENFEKEKEKRCMKILKEGVWGSMWCLRVAESARMPKTMINDEDGIPTAPSKRSEP